MKQFKVFYSWQSDLPGNTNRNFINKCIDEAVKLCNQAVEGIEIIADRDTKGLTGSPNITQTIFNKIDECDLFIADVSIINAYNVDEIVTKDDIDQYKKDADKHKSETDNISNLRYSPNPNVLIELGYAVKCLGWERVICLINTDYGEIEKLPFDLEHQRVTSYSLKDNDKEAVRKNLKGIICSTILELSTNITTHHKGKSYHIIGSYDSDNNVIEAGLVAYNLRNYSWIDDYNNDHKCKAKRLIQKIKSYDIPMKKNKNYKSTFDTYGFVQVARPSYNTDMVDYSIGKYVRDSIIELSCKYLDYDSKLFDDKFFNIGNMRMQTFAKVNPFNGESEFRIEGTDAEKEKYKKFKELQDCLIEMKELDLYLNTFDDLLLFPLAIENNSDDADANIEITIYVDSDVDLISPSVDLINPELKDCVVNIYETGFPRDLLYLQNDSDIKYDSDKYLYYDTSQPFYGNIYPGFKSKITEDDYLNAMENYIATPNGRKYIFRLASLRAKEKKWLGKIIAIKKPVNNDTIIKMKYKMISNNTSGDIEGELFYKEYQLNM